MKTKHWTDIKTNLKMGTLETTYAKALRFHGLQERRSINEVRFWLADNFGHVATVRQLVSEIEASL